MNLSTESIFRLSSFISYPPGFAGPDSILLECLLPIPRTLIKRMKPVQPLRVEPFLPLTSMPASTDLESSKPGGAAAPLFSSG